MVRLSIVIPVLNEAPQIEGTLADLQAIRRRGNEIIVADGGSEDGSAQLAQPLADVVLVADRGRARQMNMAAGVATGDVLLFLHADTRVPERADEAIFGALRNGRRSWGRFNVRIAGRSRLLPIIAAMMNFRSRLTGIATGDQGIFVRRETFFAVGRYADIPLMEDIELSARLKRMTGRPACLRPKVVTSGRRWDRYGTLNTVIMMWSLRFQFFLGVSATSLAQRYYGEVHSRKKASK